MTNGMYGDGYTYSANLYGNPPASSAAIGTPTLLWDPELRIYTDQAGNPAI